MSRAVPSCSKITRRAAIAATLGACAPARLPHGGFGAAITEHRAALAALDAAARHLCDVEEGLVEDNGQDRGSGPDDDPVLIAALAAFDAASDAESRAAWALARIRPEHPAAAAALLRYAGDVEAEGHDWPEPPDDEDGRDWACTFHRILAVALDAMG
jgi:hypothetical protein